MDHRRIHEYEFPGRVCSKALGFLNSTPLSVRITPNSLLKRAVPSKVGDLKYQTPELRYPVYHHS